MLIKPIDANSLVGPDGRFAQRGCLGNCSICHLHSSDGCRVILEAPLISAEDLLELLGPAGIALRNIGRVLAEEERGHISPEYALAEIRECMAEFLNWEKVRKEQAVHED